MRSQEGTPLTGPYISSTPGDTQLKLKNQSNSEKNKKYHVPWLTLAFGRPESYSVSVAIFTTGGHYIPKEN